MRFSSSVPLRRRVGWIRLKDEYVSALGLTYPFGTQLADDLTIEGLLAEVDTKIERLQRLLANLDAYEGPADDGTPATGPKGSATVFIVHGRASTPRLEVENLVRRATDVEPVMLADQISGGAVTLIEKPEEHLGQDSSATFAVIAARWPDLSSTGIRPSRFSMLSARSTSACVAARVTDEDLAGDVHAEEGPSVGRAWYGQLPSPSCARQDTRQSIEFETDGGPRRVSTAAHPGRRQVPTSHPRRSHTRNSPTGPQPSTLTGGSTWRVTQRAFHSATDCCCLLRCCPPGHTVASDAVADHPSALV
jgi:hypothetical protein